MKHVHVHCPKNIQNLCIQTEHVAEVADTKGICRNKSRTYTAPCIHSSNDRFGLLCRDSDIFEPSENIYPLQAVFIFFEIIKEMHSESCLSSKFFSVGDTRFESEAAANEHPLMSCVRNTICSVHY